ncbi:MAG: hypothetical protein R2806_10465 [Saprospiraceae bacterium]
MGADFGISQNPAGIGAFRWSNSISHRPFTTRTSTANLFPAGNTSDQASKFLISNVGLVSVTKPRQGKWKTSILLLASTGSRIIALELHALSGHSTGSITQRWIQQANQLPPESLGSFEAQPAYVTGAIYDFDEDRPMRVIIN